jgi:hypothetical protein
MTYKNRKIYEEISFLEVLDVLFLMAEGFSFSLDVLYNFFPDLFEMLDPDPNPMNQTVLRIRNVYPGAGIFSIPGFWI